MIGKTIDAERLLITDWTPNDAEAAFAIYGDRRVMAPMQGQPIETLEEQEQRLTDRCKAMEALPGYGFCKLIRKDDGQIVGSGILKPLPNSDWIEVGWHLRSDCWGQGYATEAGKALLDYGFGDLGLDRIYAIVHPLNEPSKRVALRLGMRLLGLTTQFHNMELELYATDKA